MIITIRTYRTSGYRFRIETFIDGILQRQATQTATLGSVINVRNELCEQWSDVPGVTEVTGDAIPFPIEYQQGAA
jgi:hypothetical protein